MRSDGLRRDRDRLAELVNKRPLDHALQQVRLAYQRRSDGDVERRTSLVGGLLGSHYHALDNSPTHQPELRAQANRILGVWRAWTGTRHLDMNEVHHRLAEASVFTTVPLNTWLRVASSYHARRDTAPARRAHRPPDPPPPQARLSRQSGSATESPTLHSGIVLL